MIFDYDDLYVFYVIQNQKLPSNLIYDYYFTVTMAVGSHVQYR
jgi:hypothetical protein